MFQTTNQDALRFVLNISKHVVLVGGLSQIHEGQGTNPHSIHAFSQPSPSRTLCMGSRNTLPKNLQTSQMLEKYENKHVQPVSLTSSTSPIPQDSRILPLEKSKNPKPGLLLNNSPHFT